MPNEYLDPRERQALDRTSSADQVSARQTGHKSQATLEREALEAAVRAKEKQIASADGRRVTDATQSLPAAHGKHPMHVAKTGEHTVDPRALRAQADLVEVIVSGCLNGRPASGRAAYFEPPAVLEP